MPRFTRKELTGRIDTAIERRMQRIAEQEARKAVVTLCLREFPQGDYDEETNAFSNHEVVAFSGSITEIGIVLKANALADIDMNGWRTSNIINVTGVSLNMRAYVKESYDQPARRDSILNYGIYAVYDDFTAVTNAIIPNDLIPYKRFCYSSILDRSPNPVDNRRKVVNLINGKLLLKATDAFPVTDSVNVYKKCNFRHQFLPLEANEDDPMTWKFFLALRSNIPDLSPYDIWPRVVTGTKFFYNQ